MPSLTAQTQQPACSRCGDTNDRYPTQRYCRRCHADYQRGWRSTRVFVSREKAAVIEAVARLERQR